MFLTGVPVLNGSQPVGYSPLLQQAINCQWEKKWRIYATPPGKVFFILILQPDSIISLRWRGSKFHSNKANICDLRLFELFTPPGKFFAKRRFFVFFCFGTIHSNPSSLLSYFKLPWNFLFSQYLQPFSLCELLHSA